MKMKLAQKLLIGYYKTKLQTIALVSPRKAGEMAVDIFCTPFEARSNKIKTPPIFDKAEKLSFEIDGLTIRGFRWRPEHPNEKKILIVHGYNSYAYKFEGYILPLLKKGFEVLAFDAPAHGTSDGKRINAYLYKNVLLKIDSLYGPLYGMMGHSLGGLAASLAFEELSDPGKRKLVLVAPATETERAINNFFHILPVDEKVREAFRQVISEIANKPISYFSVSRVIKKITSPVLWVHDKHDPICPFEDVKPLLSADLPNVNFVITEHLGHSKIYKDQKICTEIVEFFSQPLS